MATRLYITPTAIPYTPATIRGAWDATGTPSTGKLEHRPAGSNTSISKTETTATNNWDVLYGRWVSDPLTAAKTISQAISYAIRGSEANAAANAFMHLHIYVTTGDSDTVRGTLVSDHIGGSELPVTAASVGGTIASPTSVAAQIGDRIVVEIGVQFQNTVTTSYATTVQYGGTAAIDTVAGNTTAGRPKWIEFADNIPFVAKASTLSENFDDNSLNTTQWDNWGGANVTEANQRLEVVGSTVNGDYFGMDSKILYDLTDSSAFIRVVDFGANHANRVVQPMTVQATGGDNSVYWEYNNGTLSCWKAVLGAYAQVGTNLTYSSATHKFFRLREASGTLYYDWSTDGATWTNHASVATPIPLALALISVGTVGNNGAPASASYAYFDNVNITPTPLAATFQDNFNDNSIDVALWDAWANAVVPGSARETGGRFEMDNKTGGSQYLGVLSILTYDLTASDFTIELVDAGLRTLASQEIYAMIELDSNNQLGFMLAQTTLIAYKKVAGTGDTSHSATYNATNHRWLRIREASGTTYWETSPDRSTWTTLHSESNPFAINLVKFLLMNGVWASEATVVTAVWDNLGTTADVATYNKGGAFLTGMM